MFPPTLRSLAENLRQSLEQIERSASALIADPDVLADIEARESGRICRAFESFTTLLPHFVTQCTSVSEGDLAEAAAAGILAKAALHIAQADVNHLQIMGRGFLGREQQRLDRESAAIPHLSTAVRALGASAAEDDSSLLPSGCADNVQEWFRSSTETGHSFIFSPSGVPEKVTYSKVDGRALYQGCIDIGTVEYAERLCTRVEEGEFAGAEAMGRVGAQYRWPDGVIYYKVAANLPNQQRVTDAIAHWQAKTPLRFVSRTTQADFISFIIGSGCSSPVGMQGGEQFIRLADGCGLGATIHEIGHAIGLWHEQSRNDRDQFIEIKWEHIEAQKEFNFEKQSTEGFDIAAYDYGSIMHYPATAFSKDGQPTIVAKDGQPIGQRIALSDKDVAGVKVLYPNLTWP